jgi:hypothetical protein
MNNGTNSSAHAHHHDENITPAALLEQLVYVDTFMPDIDDPSQLDERLTAELSAFADDSFIFPDEEKPKKPEDERDDTSNHQAANLLFNQLSNNNFGASLSNGLSMHSFNSGLSSMLPLNSLSNNNNNSSPSSTLLQPSNNTPSDLLSTLPKVHVPPGAQSSLIAAGLSQTQIDALAALIAQHQGSKVTGGQQSSHGIPSMLASATQLNSLAELHGSSSSPSASSVNPLSTSIMGSPFGSSHTRDDSLTHHLPIDLPEVKVEPTGDVEVDKRRRNTAASARFRIKKKLKEQHLERSVRELTELTMTLEKKIQTLEMENRLLRNLVVEKGEQRNNSELELLKQRARMASDSDFSSSSSTNGFDQKKS